METENTTKYESMVKKALQKENMLLFLENKTLEYESRIALAIITQYCWKEFTYKGLGYMSRKLASYLINDLKVAKGDKVETLSESMPE